jgi:hypothetical protein
MSQQFLHKNLASGRWHEMSLVEQLGNIGSEISRARIAQDKNQDRFEAAVRRALELFNLTRSDSRWKGRLKEIGRAQDVFIDSSYNKSREYNSSLSDLDRYFTQFAIVARK